MKYPQVVSMPSAVTNWLEEQLEARGIDAVLYTRYVLSLLHSHTVDVIYPDEDLHNYSPLKKDLRRGGGRKRSRRSSEWWKHAHLDAEQLRRSAAVQCLMSASDQNCEIESLVDELCAKLQDIKKDELDSAQDKPQVPSNNNNNNNRKKVSPKEQAEKYYAAFPPLCPQSQDSPATLLALIPKWIQSPKKKQSTTANRGAQKEQVVAATMKSKQRPNCLRNRTKNHIVRLAKSDAVQNWDTGMFGKRQRTQAFVNRAYEPDQCVEDTDWPEEDVHMYDDLPVNIHELLNSPTPPEDEDYSVEMMNLANSEAKPRPNNNNNFISGNIISSIWSNNSSEDVLFDNKFNQVLDEEANLDCKFKSITIKEEDRAWVQNERNALFERQSSGSFFDGFHSLPAWSDATDLPEDEECFDLLNRVAVSLMKINHNKEKSCFAEIVPGVKKPIADPNNQQFTNPFGFGSGLYPGAKDKDDLLTSERSHFKPINEKLEARAQEYADGATFVISNNLDKIDYKRSDSGSIYLDTDGHSKKYHEFFLDEDSVIEQQQNGEFVLKFSVCQNDKACQTEDNCPLVEEGVACMDSAPIAEPELSTSQSEDTNLETPDLIIPRPESMLAEVMWRQGCHNCNKNQIWGGAEWTTSSQWDSPGLRNIWNGGEICQDCLKGDDEGLKGGGRPPPDADLRQDICQDGEQLLSDLSSVQNGYRDDLPGKPIEFSACDLSEFFVPKERKRRHSYMSSHHVPEPMENSRSSWSFASRLEEDCLIQMSTIPTLRSVTL